MLKNKVIVCVFAVFAFIVHGKSDGTDEVSVIVMEGDSVTLYTGEKGDIVCYFNDIPIVYIDRDQSKIPPDVQCHEVTERFGDRLKPDNQTGSLTITNIRNSDSGEYKISSKSSEIIFTVFASGAKGDQVKRKSVKKGESVILETPVGKNPFEEMTLYFKDTRITKMTGDPSKLCTDVQCDEKFRGRLKLDHKTGSLNVTNTRTTDAGEYKVELTISSRFSIIRSFSVTVTDEVSVTVMEGDSVTLYTTREQEDIDWYFNDIRIAYIHRDQSKICPDVQCSEDTERFRGRLKLDHQTGSLTIMNTENTDAGEYKEEITISNSVSIIRSFSVTVTDPGLSSGAKAGIIAGSVLGVLLLGAAVGGGIYLNRNKRSSDDKENMHGVPYEVLKNDG